MPDQDKFRWAGRVSRRDIQRLYESDARGMLDTELLDEVHYAIYARVCDMFEIREAQQFGRVKCRHCREPIPQPYRMGARNKSTVLECKACGWSVTCGEFYASYTGRSMLPGSAFDLFEGYLERFPKARTPSQKLLLIDWLIHQFHVMQGVARMPVGQNVIQGTTDQVRELIEGLANGPSSTQGLSSVEHWRSVYYDPVRLFKQSHSHSQVQQIAAQLGIKGRSQMSEDELIPEILRLAPELAVKSTEQKTVSERPKSLIRRCQGHDPEEQEGESMIELPEAVVIAGQITETLGGKRIARAVANASPHKFAWYTGDPTEYNDRLAGKAIGRGIGVAGNIEFEAGDMVLSVSAPIRYHVEGEKRPKKHQLLVEFEDGTAISSSAQMWGGFFCFPVGERGGYPDYDIAKARLSPLTDAFNRAYFDTLFDEDTPKLSAKAFLATEQRIPGLGNGVLQDILWTARIHPKRKMSELSDSEIDAMYAAVKQVLAEMTAQGGRDTERDLFGRPGGYKTVLSRNTVGTPCPACGTTIQKEPYLGGAIYYCAGCQKV